MKGIITCNECGFKASGKYCSNCGSLLTLRRINFKYIIDEIKEEFFFEKGYFFTVKETLFRPSKTIQKFLSQNRKKFIKPIIFILISTIIFVLSDLLVEKLYQTEFNYTAEDIKSQTLESNFIMFQGSIDAPNFDDKSIENTSFINDYYGYAYIFIIYCLAVVFKAFFYKTKYNFFEIIVMLCYVLGVQLLIKIPIDIIIFFLAKNELVLNWGPFHYDELGVLLQQYSSYTYSGLLSSIYSIWAIGMFFNGKIKSFIKSFISFYLGFYLIYWVIFLIMIMGSHIIGDVLRYEFLLFFVLFVFANYFFLRRV